ncbi:Cytochrome P450 3A31, partial [Bienertia sinuspersici]
MPFLPFSPNSVSICDLIFHFLFSEFLGKSHERYGSIIKLWLSPSLLLVSIKDPLIINELLLKGADKLPLIGKVYRLAFGQSSFFISSFEKVKRKREAFVVELNGTLLDKANAVTGKAVDTVMERVSDIMDKGALDCEIGMAKVESSKSQDPCCHLYQRDESCGYVMGMKFHGCLTTAGLISNALARLSMHPELQEKKDEDNWGNDAAQFNPYRFLSKSGKRFELSKGSETTEGERGEAEKERIDGVKMKIEDVDLVKGCVSGVAGKGAGVLTELWSDGQKLVVRKLMSVEVAMVVVQRSEGHGAVEVPSNLGEGPYILSDPHKNAAYLPFGSGLRTCVGQRFAIMGIASIFASLLEQYE